MTHLNFEIVGFEETRLVEPIRAADGSIVDLVPEQAQHWVVVSTKPNGEMVRAQISDEDWKRVIEPAMTAAQSGTTSCHFVR